jgi:hypothetical protein
MQRYFNVIAGGTYFNHWSVSQLKQPIRELCTMGMKPIGLYHLNTGVVFSSHTKITAYFLDKDY